jgi:hypothetical protein
MTGLVRYAVTLRACDRRALDLHLSALAALSGLMNKKQIRVFGSRVLPGSFGGCPAKPDRPAARPSVRKRRGE